MSDCIKSTEVILLPRIVVVSPQIHRRISTFALLRTHIFAFISALRKMQLIYKVTQFLCVLVLIFHGGLFINRLVLCSLYWCVSLWISAALWAPSEHGKPQLSVPVWEGCPFCDSVYVAGSEKIILSVVFLHQNACLSRECLEHSWHPARNAVWNFVRHAKDISNVIYGPDMNTVWLTCHRICKISMVDAFCIQLGKKAEAGAL